MLDELFHVVTKEAKYVSAKIERCFDSLEGTPYGITEYPLIAVGCLLVSAVICSTLYHAMFLKSNNVLSAFSVIRNFPEIVDVSERTSNLGAINGIRVISSIWTVYAHFLISPMVVPRTNYNGLVYPQAGHSIFQNFMVNGELAVEPFFVITGFLTCYYFLRSQAKGLVIDVF